MTIDGRKNNAKKSDLSRRTVKRLPVASTPDASSGSSGKKTSPPMIDAKFEEPKIADIPEFFSDLPEGDVLRVRKEVKRVFSDSQQPFYTQKFRTLKIPQTEDTLRAFLFGRRWGRELLRQKLGIEAALDGFKSIGHIVVEKSDGKPVKITGGMEGIPPELRDLLSRAVQQALNEEAAKGKQKDAKNSDTHNIDSKKKKER
jgi:hypothetical protein